MAVVLTIVALVLPVVAQSNPKEKSVNKAKPSRTKDAPAVAGINEYSSKNFVLRTDMSSDEAKELLTQHDAAPLIVCQLREDTVVDVHERVEQPLRRIELE